MNYLRIIIAHLVLQIFIVYFCKAELLEQRSSHIEFAKKELGNPKETAPAIEEIFFPPDITAKKVLLGLIQNEKEKILIAQYRFNDAEVLQALIDALVRGVKILLIVDQSAIQDKYQKIKNAFDAQIKTRYYAYPFSIMHHKLFIFFNNFCNRAIVVTGSVNATPSGYGRNKENMLVTNSENIVRKCKQKYAELKKDTQPCKAALFEKEPAMAKRKKAEKNGKKNESFMPKGKTGTEMVKTVVDAIRKIR